MFSNASKILGFAGIRYQEEEEEEDVTATPGWDYEENYVVPSSGYKKNSGYGNQRYNDDDDGYGKNSYKNDDDYGYGKNSYRDDDDDGYDYGSSKYAPSRQVRNKIYLNLLLFTFDFDIETRTR